MQASERYLLCKNWRRSKPVAIIITFAFRVIDISKIQPSCTRWLGRKTAGALPSQLTIGKRGFCESDSQRTLLSSKASDESDPAFFGPTDHVQHGFLQ